MKNLIIIGLILLIGCNGSSYSDANKNYPLTKDTLNVFPNEILIHANVVDFNCGMSCGHSAGCSFMKVELKNKIVNYPSQFVYIALPCYVYTKPDIIGQNINIELKKISINDTSLFFKNTYTGINSNNIPWYQPSPDKIIHFDWDK